MSQHLKDLLDAVSEPAFDRRKAKRLLLKYPVEISGIDVDGIPFTQQTKTDDVSDIGCRLVVKYAVKIGDVLKIKLSLPAGENLPAEEARDFQVMWVQAVRSGWSIGAKKLLKDAIWKVSFPPPRLSS